MANIGIIPSDFDEESITVGTPVNDSTMRSPDHSLEIDKVSQGTFDDSDDGVDYYEFQTIAGHAYQIVVTSDPLYRWNQFKESSTFDFDILDDSILPVPLFESVNGEDSQTQEVTFTAPKTGTYYVEIDGKGEGFDYAATISDLGISSDPTAVNDLYYIDLNTFLTADSLSGLLRNDSDPNTDPLTVTGTNYGGPGTLFFDPDGSFTYQPAPDFNGDDTFTYTISDGNGGTATGTVTINVDPEPPFQLDVFDNKGQPMDGDMAYPGSVLAFRPTPSFPGRPVQFLSELGPVEFLARPTGTSDPFVTIGLFAGDVNAIVVGENLVGMDVLAQAENGAIFQTNIVPVDTPPFPPILTQSFGGPLVMPDPLTPGGLLIDTNTVDDLRGFGSPPTICVEVEYRGSTAFTTKTLTIDVTDLVIPNPGGDKISLLDIRQAVYDRFEEVEEPGDELLTLGSRGPVLDAEIYSFIKYRFIKKYLDGDGVQKIVKAPMSHELVVAVENQPAENEDNFKTIDFTATTPPVRDPANIYGFGDAGSNVLIGNGNANLLDAGPGDDILISKGASDSLLGGAGDDDAIAGPGFTFFDGGPDSDTFHVDGNYFDFLLVSGSTDGGFFNLHVIDTRPGSPLSNSVLRNTEMIGFRDGVLNAETAEFNAFGGFTPDGTPVSSSTNFQGVVFEDQVFFDFEAFQTVAPFQAQGLSFGQDALTESTDGVLEFNGHTYSIDPPFNAYLDLRENEGRIEVFVTDADYYNHAPPGTVDQSFSITVTNALGTTTYDFPFFIGRPDVAPVTDMGLSAATVSENADAGTVIGAVQLTFVDDPDVEEDFLLQISGTDAALFDFDDAGNLVVADGANIDFETQQAANIIISATNLNGEVFEKAFEITVGNMPISDIAMVSGGTVREGAHDDTVVATFESSENPVEPTAVLSIVSGGDGLFYLDGNELKVSPNAGSVFDFDTQSNYFITFSSTDGNGPAYEESFDIFVENVGPILGTPDEDILDGTQFDDEILALESDDIINASDGDDDIDGGPGTDTVVYERGRNQITHDLQNDGTIVVTRTALGEGTDRLTNVERIDLVDGSLLYDIVTPNLGFIYRIYEAAFNRTPDELGLLFWMGEADLYDSLGWSEFDKQHHIARIFNESLEFRLIFGENTTNREYIDAMYRNVLDRPPEPAGSDYWTGRMDAGTGRDEILVFFAESVENRIFTDPLIEDGVWVV